MPSFETKTRLIALLRLAIGFGFLPAGTKKLIGQRFTDAGNTGAFHEFLHAFYDTGLLYHFVGLLQVVGALLLLTQYFALAGALLLLPIVVVIAVLCIATAGLPTIVTVLCMLGGLGILIFWDRRAWLGVVKRNHKSYLIRNQETKSWAVCGIVILGIFLLSCIAHGGVYRPRGFEPTEPSFYMMPAAVLACVVTWMQLRNR